MQEAELRPTVTLTLIPAKQEPNCAWCGQTEPERTSEICKPHEMIEAAKTILRYLKRRNDEKLIA